MPTPDLNMVDFGRMPTPDLNTIKEISNSLSTLEKKDSNGLVDAITKFSKYSGYISELAGALGGSIAFFGVLGNIGFDLVAGWGKDEHNELMNEFEKFMKA